MTMTAAEKYGDRIFNPARPDRELPRLAALAGMHDTDTLRCLAALGASPGWRCLDVGTGPGHVARHLAHTVGPSGWVLAMDRDTRLLESTDLPPNVKPLEADALTAEPGEFDLVHCRFLLMHVPQRAELLARLASWVKPGGWLMVGDHVDLATHSSPYPAIRQTFAAMRRMLNATIGTDFNFARDYAGRLRTLGLVDVSVDASTPGLRAGSAANEFWLRTWDQLWPRMQLDEDVYREARRLLKDPEVVDLSLTLLTAWGRRPDHQ